MTRHPEVVLDGGTLVTVPIFERLGSNGRRTLVRLAAACRANAACSRAYPTWKRDLPRLLERLARRRVRVTVAGVGRVSLDELSAAGTIQSLTLNPSDAGEVPYVVARAVRGDYQPLARASARSSTGSGLPTAVMPWSVMCNEPWAVRDPARAAADASGTFFRAPARAAAARQATICAVFPKRHEDAADWRPPRAQAPLLAVVGGADPQDPLANIEGIRRTMPNSTFVVVPGGFHTNSHLGCLPALVTRFVDRGTAAGLDTSCARTAVRPSWTL